jgi:hypothetical protein
MIKNPVERRERLASQGGLVRVIEAPKLSPRDAAFFRKLGTYIDSCEVLCKDDGLLDPDDADELRQAGVLVLDEEIAPHVEPIAMHRRKNGCVRK